MLRAFAKYLQPQLLNRKGYTIDQTILIVAIIAILITLIIITIGWQLINRTSGTKLGSQLKQVEDAVSQFYAANRVFPHQSFAVAPTNTIAGNVLVLTGTVPAGATMLPTISPNSMSNYLGGFKINGTTNVQSSYGNTITMQSGIVTPWTGASNSKQYYIIEFVGVPQSDAVEADRAIDGNQPNSNSTGRLVYSNTGCQPTSGGTVPTITASNEATVFVCYVASPLN